MKKHTVALLVGLAGLAGVTLLPGCSQSEAPSTIVPPNPEASPVTIYTAEQFYLTTAYRLGSAAGFGFSTDGSRVLVSSDTTGVFNVYALSVVGGESHALTDSSTDSTYAVTYFPEDDRVLLTADEGGNELNHLYVRNLDGTITDLTPGENLKARFIGWAQDNGGFFAATNERDPRAFDMYRYDVESYERVRVFENTDALGLRDISSDGRWLALSKPHSSADSDLYLLDLQADGARPELITPHEGAISHGVFGFNPDNTGLVYGTDEHGEFRQAWLFEIAGKRHSPYIEEDWDVLFVGFSKSGNYRVWGVNVDARTVLKILDLRTNTLVAMPEMPGGDLANIRFSRDETSISLLVSSDQMPRNVHVVNLATSTQQQLTDALNEEVNSDDLVASEVIRYSSFDDLEIPGILYKPKSATAGSPVPALVWVHGGPGGQSRPGYNPMIQHLVNHGYAVFAANNRGSSGYGKTYYHLDDKKHGTVDLDDIVYAGKYLAGLDWVDGERIGIIGGSYGGYMVAAALAFRPDAFEVGIDIFGVTNWVRTLKSIPPWWTANKVALYDELGDPATDEERLRAISPLFHTENVRVPLLVIQGANDPRVLQVESDELVANIRANGVSVDYLVLEDEGHGFSKRGNRIAVSEAFLTFLQKNLTLASID